MTTNNSTSRGVSGGTSALERKALELARQETRRPFEKAMLAEMAEGLGLSLFHPLLGLVAGASLSEPRSSRVV